MPEQEKEVQELKDQIETFGSLEAVCNSKGGKILVSGLKKDIVSAVDELGLKYKTATHIELVSTIAKLYERLLILRSLTRAEKNKKVYTEQLKEILSE